MELEEACPGAREAMKRVTLTPPGSFSAGRAAAPPPRESRAASTVQA
jgi:hypothetical protein